MPRRVSPPVPLSVPSFATTRTHTQAKWEECKKQGIKEGKRLPKRPRESKVLSSRVNEGDTGL